MRWIAEAEKQWLSERERDARIEANATDIYEALWAEILRGLTEARSLIERFSDLTTNGRQLAHVISFPMDKSSQAIGPPRSVEIALEKSEHQIVASSGDDEINIQFGIDVCKSDGSVCLKFDGKKISYEDASKRVLSAFLYPGMKLLEKHPIMTAVSVPAISGRKPPRTHI